MDQQPDVAAEVRALLHELADAVASVPTPDLLRDVLAWAAAGARDTEAAVARLLAEHPTPEPPTADARPLDPDPAEPPAADTEPTGPPVADTEPTQPPAADAEPAEPPAPDRGAAGPSAAAAEPAGVPTPGDESAESAVAAAVEPPVAGVERGGSGPPDAAALAGRVRVACLEHGLRARDEAQRWLRGLGRPREFDSRELAQRHYEDRLREAYQEYDRILTRLRRRLSASVRSVLDEAAGYAADPALRAAAERAGRPVPRPATWLPDHHPQPAWRGPAERPPVYREGRPGTRWEREEYLGGLLERRVLQRYASYWYELDHRQVSDDLAAEFEQRLHGYELWSTEVADHVERRVREFATAAADLLAAHPAAAHGGAPHSVAEASDRAGAAALRDELARLGAALEAVRDRTADPDETGEHDAEPASD